MRTLALSSLLLLASTTAAHADGPESIKKTVTVSNETKRTVARLFAATAKYDGRTGSGTLVADGLKLAPGKSTTVKIPLLRGECMFHLRAETVGGSEVRAFDVDICRLDASAKLTEVETK